MYPHFERTLAGTTWAHSEESIIIMETYSGKELFNSNPMELVDGAISFLELSKEKNWKLLDARGIEILREATINDYIERLQKVI